MPIDEGRVSGDLGVARGTYSLKFILKEQDIRPWTGTGNFTVVLARQKDRSWKWEWMITNSDQPQMGSTATGEDGRTLIQIERDAAAAAVKGDMAVMERILAKECTGNSDGKVSTRAQVIAEFRSGAFKYQSMETSDLSPHVFGDFALVTGTTTTKGTYKGKDISGRGRGADFFVKRDGQWKVVNSQNFSIK